MSITLLHDWSKCLICLLNAENMLQILYYTQHLQMIYALEMGEANQYLQKKRCKKRGISLLYLDLPIPGDWSIYIWVEALYAYLRMSLLMLLFCHLFINFFLYAEVFSEIKHQYKRIDIDLLNFLEINKRDYEIHFVYKDKNRIYENTQICQRLIFYIFFHHWSV